MIKQFFLQKMSIFPLCGVGAMIKRIFILNEMSLFRDIICRVQFLFMVKYQYLCQKGELILIIVYRPTVRCLHLFLRFQTYFIGSTVNILIIQRTETLINNSLQVVHFSYKTRKVVSYTPSIPLPLLYINQQCDICYNYLDQMIKS